MCRAKAIRMISHELTFVWWQGFIDGPNFIGIWLQMQNVCFLHDCPERCCKSCLHQNQLTHSSTCVVLATPLHTVSAGLHWILDVANMPEWIWFCWWCYGLELTSISSHLECEATFMVTKGFSIECKPETKLVCQHLVSQFPNKWNHSPNAKMLFSTTWGKAAHWE